MAPHTVLTGAFALALGLAAVGAAWAETVLLADGQPLLGELRPGNAPGELQVRRTDQSVVTVKRDDLLAVDFGRPPGEPEPTPVTLHTGDRLAGTVSFEASATVVVKRAAGRMAVPLSVVSSLRLKSGAVLPAPGASDTVVLLNGDRLVGRVEEVAPTQVTVRSSLGKTPVDVKRIAGVVMGRRDVVATGEGLRVALDLVTGERLSGRWLTFTEEQIGIEMTGVGRVEVPLSSVARLVVQNGRLVFLSDLHPVEAKQVPYLDVEHPHRVNQSQGGRVLQLGGTRYSHGLGVHSRSELTYQLGGKFKQFATMIGVDDEVGDAGSVIFRIWGDERLLFESPVMQGGDAPRSIQVDVSGVLLLRLEVDHADDGDFADHADWANARLLR